MKLAEIAVEVDDGHVVVHLCLEALLEALEVVVRSSAAGLFTLQTFVNTTLQAVCVAWKAFYQTFVVSGLLQVEKGHCISTFRFLRDNKQ